MKILLPKKENISLTSEEDPLKYYYMPLIKELYIKRLKMVLDLIGPERGKVLEIGYGSGILFLELSKRFDYIHGVDLHDKGELVKIMLNKEGIEAYLTVGSILNLPYKKGEFDVVVVISVLEHISDLDKASSEIFWVLKPEGKVIIGFPAVSKKMDFLFRMIGCRDIKKHHVSSENMIISSMKKNFILEEIRKFPSFFPFLGPLYFVSKWRRAYR